MNDLIGWLGAAYMPVKAAHVVVTFFWIAGLFMLPRYLVHQASVPIGSPEDQNWGERTAKLRRIILGPSMALVWILGLMLATSYGFKSAGWIHGKIALVFLLTGYQGWMTATAKKMARGERPLGRGALRMINEIPAVFVIIIVVLAVLKPF